MHEISEMPQTECGTQCVKSQSFEVRLFPHKVFSFFFFFVVDIFHRTFNASNKAMQLQVHKKHQRCLASKREAVIAKAWHQLQGWSTTELQCYAPLTGVSMGQRKWQLLFGSARVLPSAWSLIDGIDWWAAPVRHMAPFPNQIILKKFNLFECSRTWSWKLSKRDFFNVILWGAIHKKKKRDATVSIWQ